MVCRHIKCVLKNVVHPEIYCHQTRERKINMKIIETTYNNYRFRSRLEARWAIFFDCLGIEYEYEKEGYDIRGTWYLPDFWLPKQECWFEVKGDNKAVSENYNLYQHFAFEVGPIVVFTNPSIDVAGTRFVTCSHESNGGFATGDVEWHFCPLSGFQLPLKCSSDCTVWTDCYESSIEACSDCDWNHHNPDHLRIHSAYKTARQARFEHGQNNDNLSNHPAKRRPSCQ